MSDVGTELVAERVALLELRRPPHNFFDEALLTDLADALLALDDDDSVTSVVLCAQGRNFCAGADLRGVGASGIRRVYRQAFRIFSGRKPVVAAVQGGAIGGGLGLAMAARLPGRRPGRPLHGELRPAGLPPRVRTERDPAEGRGHQRALELLYTGRSVSGKAALELGLCDQVADGTAHGSNQLAEQIAASAPLSVPAIRATMRRALVADVSAALSTEADAQAALLGTADFAEGVAASIGKRTTTVHRFVIRDEGSICRLV